MAPPSKNIRGKKPSTAATTSTTRNAESTPNYDALRRQMAYGKFLRAMLEECLVEEKIEQEEIRMEIQLGQLTNRFQEAAHQLDMTNLRLKEIGAVVEQKRLLDLKNQDCERFYNITDNSDLDNVLNNLEITEKDYVDRLETRNVDLGYTKETGHEKLLVAVNEAIDGLMEVKKHSNLDDKKFKEYEKSLTNLNKLDEERLDLKSLKSEFEIKFPKFSEKLLKEVSKKLATITDIDKNEDDT